MKYSRALAAVAGTVLVAGLAAGCGGGSSDGTASSAGGGGASASGDAGGQKKDLVVGVSNTLAGNGWRETMICSIKAQALASGQVSKVVVVSKNGGPTEQIQDLQNLVSQGVNILIVNPSDPEKLNSIIAEATKQGITVVAVDSSVTAPEAYVVTNDQVAWGKLEMEALAKLIGGKGEVLYMRGIQGVQADTDRDTGVQEVIKANPDIKLKEVWTGWDYTKGGEIAVQEFTAKQYDAVWTSGTDYTAVNAIKTAGKNPVPVGGQESNEFVKQLSEGTPGVMVTNPAVIGGAALTVALKVVNGEKVDKDFKITPKVYTSKDNAAELKAMYVPDKDQTYNATVSIDGLTTYTKDQLMACKGPGE